MKLRPMQVFYSPAMAVPGHKHRTSPSAGKPALVVANWLANAVLAPYVQLVEPTPATAEELTCAHSPEYVEGVLSGRLENGFGDTDPAVAAACLHTVGSMRDAALAALAPVADGEPARVTCSPSSGFHHAAWNHGHGFCTFNGLLVAAHAALARTPGKVAILDCDFHFGDGTDAILREQWKSRFPDLYNRVLHWSVSVPESESAPNGAQLAGMLRSAIHTWKRHGVSLILYQAGADMHIDDPLGGSLNDVGMARRENAVFFTAASAGIPVAWNLAGGYRRDARGGISPVLATHRQTFCAAVGLGAGGGEAMARPDDDEVLV